MPALGDEVQAEQDRKDAPRGPVYAETVKWSVVADEASFVMPPGADIGDLPELLRKRGIDPDEWHVERVTVNEWEALASGGGPDGEPRVVKLRQMKANLRNRKMVVGPAAEVEQRYVPHSPAGMGKPNDRLVMVIGDQQAPYQDDDLHAAVLRWLSDVQPHEGVLAGDTADFPTISRHRDRIRWSASVQECVNGAYRLISDYRDAHPGATWKKLRGNHDWRLESELMDRAERMAFLRPADRGDEQESHLYSIRRLLHLDALGVELVGEEGEDWRFGEVSLGPGVGVRHEPPSKEKIARLNRSILAGHTHRQGIKMVTTYTPDNDPIVREIVEIGCTARVKGGLGYATDPDWQQGFATVSINADGSHSTDLATWRNGSLHWCGERWKP